MIILWRLESTNFYQIVFVSTYHIGIEKNIFMLSLAFISLNISGCSNRSNHDAMITRAGDIKVSFETDISFPVF